MYDPFIFKTTFLIILVIVSSEKETIRRLAYWEYEQTSYRVMSTVLQSLSIATLLSCHHRCLANSTCFSLRTKKQADGLFLCELLSKDSASSSLAGEWMTYSHIPGPTSCRWPSQKCSKFGTCTRRSNIVNEVCLCHSFASGKRCEYKHLELSATSYGFYDPGYRNSISKLYINEMNQLLKRALRGFNLLTLNMQNGQIIEKRHWDTWAYPSLFDDIVSYINLLANNTPIAIVVHDTPSYDKVSQELLDALSLLSGKIIYLSHQYSFCFFGVKGKPYMSWSTKRIAGLGEGPVHCNTSFVITLDAEFFN